MKKKLVIALVGLPARGKSTMARKLGRTLELDGISVQIFNNGDLRRRLAQGNTSHPEFFSPDNPEGMRLREKCARINLDMARAFLAKSGEVVILDASNVTRERRHLIAATFPEVPILFIECVNADEEALEANFEHKASMKEFSHLGHEEALASFKKRVAYYESVYEPLSEEPNRLLVDSFDNWILQEQTSEVMSYYDRIRDIVTTRVVRNLFLVRHAETSFNLEDRIGGDSELTERGLAQALALADYFATQRIPIIFTSDHRRTLQTAAPIAEKQEHCSIIALPEFNEINAGICDGMSYREIREQMPEVARARNRNKYWYVYPEGEGYAVMEKRIHRGMKKVFYLNKYDDNIMIVGHQAVNRMILSEFLYRPKEDVPYIHMPQDRYYHIQIDPYKKIFELSPFASNRSQGDVSSGEEISAL